MYLMRRCILMTVMFVVAATSARAAEIVRDPGLIETMPVQGVTLAMTPREAFDHLLAKGYNAGPITTFEEWNTGGLNLVFGDFSAPEGRSEITLARARAGDRLVNISETFNRPQQKFDTHAEIQAVQNHFGIPADNPKCFVNDADTGTCRVADAEENANHAYGLSAFPTMILRYATRNSELKDSLW